MKVNDINDPITLILFQNAHLMNSLDRTSVTSAPVLLGLTFIRVTFGFLEKHLLLIITCSFHLQSVSFGNVQLPLALHPLHVTAIPAHLGGTK